MKDVEFSELIGKTLVTVVDLKLRSDRINELRFVCSDGSAYRMYHIQDCCEDVSLEDICGDWSDILNQVVLAAEEASNIANPEYTGLCDSHTWTFYRITTQRGQVVLRWLGESNGYYSEKVTFEQII